MEVVDQVKEFFEKYIAPPYKVTGVETKEDGGWKITIEVTEEKEYMKRYAKDEMLGVYEVHVDEDQEITSYNRTHMRYRSALEEQE
ncbi:gas vesicle protein GvpO [Thalassobacillus hwangdonensis]|uniref:Gas vesicle protein GvpO n=1 Tax=Thalassobacillus hwangdonensis TaxID=546108 RepID=A0ABW3L7G0_9BACI